MDPWLDDFKQTIESAASRLLQISETQSEQPRAVRRRTVERRSRVSGIRPKWLGQDKSLPGSAVVATCRPLARLQPSLASRDGARRQIKTEHAVHSAHV